MYFQYGEEETAYLSARDERMARCRLLTRSRRRC